jgi:hypothetical protein
MLLTPPLGPIEQRQCRYEMEGKTVGIGDRFPEESLDGKRQDASVFDVRYGNGRISPGDG